MSEAIYLDNNSTTQMLPEVVEAMTECLRAGYLNPASQHGSGRAARRVLEAAREQIASLLGASLAAPHQDQLLFTSGATESNNLAIRGLVQDPGDVLVSDVEHPSVLAAAESLEHDFGCRVVRIPVDAGGHVSTENVGRLISDQTRIVCVMAGNNEVGSLLPIGEIAQLCSEQNIPVHCDAVQHVGKLPTSFQQLGITSLAFSGHKFHGPRGIGGLLVRSHTRMKPLLQGGSQQFGLRPGTEPIASVVGMAKALELATADRDAPLRIASLRNRLEQSLVASCDCSVNGTEPRLPHVLNVSFPGIDRQALLMALDLAGVECSTGSACTSGSSEPSHVLVAMGCPTKVVESSLRFSLSRLTTMDEIDEAAYRITAVVSRLR